ILGVNVDGLDDDSQRSLLISALDNVSKDKVDTPTKIDTINGIVGKILNAAGNATKANQLAITDFTGVGVNELEGADDGILQNMRDAVAALNKNDIDSVAELKVLADGLLRDLKAIRDYATGVVTLPPTVANYANARINGVTSDNLDSINAAIRVLGSNEITVSQVRTPANLQKVVAAYNRVLLAADNGTTAVAPSLTRDDLTSIGVQISEKPGEANADRNAAALKLLLTTLELQPADKSTVKTPALINELAELSGKIADYADGLASATAPNTADLTKLQVKSILAENGATPSTEGLIQDMLKSFKNSGEHALASLDLTVLQNMAHVAYKLRDLTSTSGTIAEDQRPDAGARDAAGNPLHGARLTLDELKLLGLDVADASAERIKLLNDAIDVQNSFETVSTLAKLKALKLDDIVKRVMQQADAGEPDPAHPARLLP
ncbi:hypothetical protein, partial [Herbaspirillum sp. B65]|uniref:hypothetical protein n=1 Tax=Herbaspirillum sp. B65 TaxID=137708 RepID=UPI0005CB2DF0